MVSVYTRAVDPCHGIHYADALLVHPTLLSILPAFLPVAGVRASPFREDLRCVRFGRKASLSSVAFCRFVNLARGIRSMIPGTDSIVIRTAR